jgi:Flp pilus assembly pilin Flp
MWTDSKRYVHTFVASVARREEGQTLTEYALILGVVAAALVAVLTIMTGGISQLFNTVVGSFPGA